MGEEYTSQLREKKSMVSGKQAKELDGLTEERSFN
jgi:hypothetical protein